MSLLCAAGLHKWKPHYRLSSRPFREELLMPVIPGLFSGPPYLARTGIYFVSGKKYVCDRCRRCGSLR